MEYLDLVNKMVESSRRIDALYDALDLKYLPGKNKAVSDDSCGNCIIREKPECPHIEQARIIACPSWRGE